MELHIRFRQCNVRLLGNTISAIYAIRTYTIAEQTHIHDVLTLRSRIALQSSVCTENRFRRRSIIIIHLFIEYFGFIFFFFVYITRPTCTRHIRHHQQRWPIVSVNRCNWARMRCQFIDEIILFSFLCILRNIKKKIDGIICVNVCCFDDALDHFPKYQKTSKKV